MYASAAVERVLVSSEHLLWLHDFVGVGESQSQRPEVNGATLGIMGASGADCPLHAPITYASRAADNSSACIPERTYNITCHAACVRW